MLKTITIFLMLFAISICASPFNDGFALKNEHLYINNAEALRHDIGFEKVYGMKGMYCLRLLNENQEDAEFIMQPIKAGKKYQLTFNSKFVNIETLENNPTFEVTTRPGFIVNLKHLPTFELIFLDKDKESLSAPRSFKVALPFGEWHETCRAFIAPPNAAFMQCSFVSGINNGKLYLDDMKFKELETPASGVHFKFEGGKYDYSFFGPRNDAGMIEKDGKKYFMTGYGNITDTFVLNSDTDYTVLIKGIQLKGYHAVSINYFDEDMNTVGKEALIDPCNLEVTITTPKETKYGNVFIYSHLLEDIIIKQK